MPATCPSAGEVGGALHLSVPVVHPGPGLGALICSYLISGSVTQSEVTVSFTPLQSGETPADYEAELSGLNSNVKPVPGVGDAAFSFTSTGNSALGFIGGGTICVINTTVPVNQADVISLAKTILNG